MMVQTPVRKRISRFLGRETVAEARTEHRVLGEKVGSLVLRFAARLGAIEGGNCLGRPPANNGAC
jgi:hypothetical protein